MRERQRELGSEGDVVIEGRDIGTVVAPDAEVKVYLVADPAGARAAAPGRAARHRRRRARDRPQAPRRVRPRAHAAGRRRRGDRHDPPRDRRRRRADRGPRPRRAPARRAERGLRRFRLADLAALHVAARRLRSRAAAATGSTGSRAGRLRARDQPPRLDRHPARRRALAAEHQLRREDRGARRAGPRPASSAGTGSSRPARRVRPRRGAADAPGCAPTGARSASSSRARGRRRGVPGRGQPGAAMVAIQEDVPVVPIAVYGTQFWKLGNFAPCSIAVGEPFRSRASAGRPGYKEASLEIERRINVLFDWLADVHARGRPARPADGRARARVRSTTPVTPDAAHGDGRRRHRRASSVGRRTTTCSARSRSSASRTSASRR